MGNPVWLINQLRRATINEGPDFTETPRGWLMGHGNTYNQLALARAHYFIWANRSSNAGTHNAIESYGLLKAFLEKDREFGHGQHEICSAMYGPFVGIAMLSVIPTIRSAYGLKDPIFTMLANWLRAEFALYDLMATPDYHVYSVGGRMGKTGISPIRDAAYQVYRTGSPFKLRQGQLKPEQRTWLYPILMNQLLRMPEWDIIFGKYSEATSRMYLPNLLDDEVFVERNNDGFSAWAPKITSFTSPCWLAWANWGASDKAQFGLIFDNTVAHGNQASLKTREWPAKAALFVGVKTITGSDPDEWWHLSRFGATRDFGLR